MYSYDRTAAILPLVIDEARVQTWLDHIHRTKKKVKTMVMTKGSQDTEIEVFANFNDGSNERYTIRLKFEWKSRGLHIRPQFTRNF